MVARIPNDRLRALLTEIGCSGAALAREVNAVAAESGERTEYTRSSVGQWLAGIRPRPPVPQYVAEALSRRMRRRVTPADAGLPEQESPSVYNLADLSVATWTAAPRDHSRRPKAQSSSIRFGTPEVTAARTALRLFSDSEHAFGSGHVRHSLVDYLSVGIEPLLQGRCTSEKTRREFMSVATRLVYLCGFTYFDEGMHGKALRHYRKALDLAAEASAPELYAITLRAMSVQAHVLGHHAAAAHLGEAAMETASSTASPQTKAFVSGQLAVAKAAIGDRLSALAYLDQAERQFERAAEDSDVIGKHHMASLAHQRAEVCAALHDQPAAVKALKQSIRHRPAGELRSRAITLARLAELQLESGEVERAVDAWHHFLDIFPLIHSQRAATALAVMRARLRPHGRSHCVAHLHERALTMQRIASRRSIPLVS